MAAHVQWIHRVVNVQWIHSMAYVQWNEYDGS